VWTLDRPAARISCFPLFRHIIDASSVTTMTDRDGGM
jgi:hypothetical protein